MSHGVTHHDRMFSVRTMPGTGSASCSTVPRSIDEALEKAGLGWKVTYGDVLVVRTQEWTDDSGTKHPAELIPAKGFKANLRADTGAVLGIVSDEYEVVDSRDAFRILDAARTFTSRPLAACGSAAVCGAWPEYIELGGDRSATYIYVANSHDGSMALTAAVTPIRIVCANTLGAALRQTEHGANAQRTFRFRHTGNLQTKLAEARQVLGTTINYEPQFKALADRLALEPMTETALERRMLRHLWVIDEDTGPPARPSRERAIEHGSRSSAGAARREPPPVEQNGSHSRRIAEHSATGGATRSGQARCCDPSRIPRSSAGARAGSGDVGRVA
jgi:phage/plasmid-like protein (TIGR03299 family)